MPTKPGTRRKNPTLSTVDKVEKHDTKKIMADELGWSTDQGQKNIQSMDAMLHAGRDW